LHGYDLHARSILIGFHVFQPDATASAQTRARLLDALPKTRIVKQSLVGVAIVRSNAGSNLVSHALVSVIAGPSP
jgi:hypothetical protein